MSSYNDLKDAVESFEATNQELTEAASSAVVRAELAASEAESAAESAQRVVTGDLIDDALTSPNMLWSSQKTNSEIKSVQSEIKSVQSEIESVQSEIGGVSLILDNINGEPA